MSCMPTGSRCCARDGSDETVESDNAEAPATIRRRVIKVMAFLSVVRATIDHVKCKGNCYSCRSKTKISASRIERREITREAFHADIAGLEARHQDRQCKNRRSDR